jgi:hypothetical protein
MMMRSLIAAALVVLSGCASKPQPPAWEGDAKSSLDGYTDDFLRGDSAAADAEFARARRASASTGRFDVVAQAELVRCGVKAAALDYECPGFAAVANDATPAQRAYAAYLDCCRNSTAPSSPAVRWPALPIHWAGSSRPGRC